MGSIFETVHKFLKKKLSFFFLRFRWLGCKWAITVSFLAYMPFIIAQFYPRLYSLVPAGMMVGFGGGPLWCAKCTYLSVVSKIQILRLNPVAGVRCIFLTLCV